jgi:hypothetical protein
MTYDDYDRFIKYMDEFSASDYHSFLKLTTEATFTEGCADWVFIPWISNVQKSGGAGNWIRIAERRDECTFDLHVLIGGGQPIPPYKLMRSWEQQAFAREARRRRLGETEPLRGLIQYLVLQRGCGFRASGLWGGLVGIKGEDYGY